KDIMKGQVWRLFTPIFRHGDVLHILFNMMWMVDLGRRIEPIRGTTRFVGLVLCFALFSNLAEAGWAAVSPWEPQHFSVFFGMSGVVSGLFGYAWMCGRFRPYERIAVGQQELGYMLGWLVICSFGFVGPIANAAHWGGLVIGMAIGAAPSLWRKVR
ncbi:MAG: glpG 2, partial [Phycisphaerales bacterium]|nr:glpG 2 [Phycisphaerales bacterium]